jgi:hypothetical protein
MGSPKTTRLVLLLSWRLALGIRNEGDVNIFLAFSKTGSSTLRQAFADRARAQGWQAYARGGWSVCHLNATTPGHCDGVPNAYVVQASAPGLDACGEFAPRPCRMILLLREPVARAVSSYYYYNVACSDGFACDRNVSLVDFVRAAPRHPYIDRFAPYDDADADARTASAVAAVERSARNGAALVLFTETLDCARGELNAFVRGADVGALRHAKRRAGNPEPAAADLAALRDLLRYDVAFYDRLFAEYGRDCRGVT